MTWGALAVAAVGAVGAGVSASQANKRAKSAGNSLNESIAFARRDLKGVFGEKLDWRSIDYTPIWETDPGYGGVARDVVAGNQRNLPAALQLASGTNEGITADALARLDTLYPQFQDSFNQQAQNTQSFLRGELPMTDSDRLKAQRSEAVSLGGGGGNLAQQTAADLGLSRVELMNQGAANLTNNTNLLNIFDPISRHMTPQSSFVDVGQALQQYAAENQFNATFAASERDGELAWGLTPDPQKAGLMNLLAARGGAQAASPQQNVWASALMGGATAGVGAWAGQQNAQAAQAAAAPAAQYVPTQQATVAYATPADRSAGIQTLSGTGGSYSSTPTGYNPSTGAQWGEQGGLWSYYNKPKNSYSFQ